MASHPNIASAVGHAQATADLPEMDLECDPLPESDGLPVAHAPARLTIENLVLMLMFRRLLSFTFAISAGLSALMAAEPPVIPVGEDAYLQWERWPYQRIGARAYMRSTYDRAGGNEGADASHFLYQKADDFNVTLDVEGPGIICFARYNHWHGSPWHYVVDGRDHIVQESSTVDPTRPVKDSVFLPEAAFPPPLAVTWSTTKGADLSWAPIPFEKSFQMAYSRTRYGTGYYIYQQFVPGARLSRPLKAWDGKTPPASAVLDIVNAAGTDLAPAAGAQGVVQVGEKSFVLKRDQNLLQKVSVNQPAMLRALEFSGPRDQAVALGRARVKITWDDEQQASVDAPLALFYGAGTLYNRDGREYLVKAFPVNIRYDESRVYLSCYFPMPFFRQAKFELSGSGEADLTDLNWSARYQPFHDPESHVGYFHATYRDHPNPVLGHDLVLLDTRETEGGGDWSGQFIGTSFIFSHRANLRTLEGDPRFFFDDSQSAQAYGTGTEEWGGGGDYWGGANMTLPFAGHPVGAKSRELAIDEEDQIQSAYRFLLGDLMPFGKNAVIRLEHGGHNGSVEHYETVTYWYGRRGATLVKTDELQIGDIKSELAHHYTSPDASEPYEIESRYEWGVDQLTLPESPRDQPDDFAEFRFQADAGKRYYIWVRGRNLDGKMTSDASWLQFNREITTSRLARSYGHPKGFGNWLDRTPMGVSSWSSALPQEAPMYVGFAQSGTQRVRLQPRRPGHVVEKIWLSATQKSRPAADHPLPQADADNILIEPADAVLLRGEVKLTSDGELYVGGRPSESARTIDVYPAHKEIGRKTAGLSEFTLKLDLDNLGIMLRRTLDYQYPNQRAEVFVADEHGGDWQSAGIWYTAGSNTCVYSNPREELGATEHRVQTSNRRFRDDEFLISRELTQGRSSIRVKVKFTPTNFPPFSRASARGAGLVGTALSRLLLHDELNPITD